MSDGPEPHFQSDLNETMDAVDDALEQLTKVKAYTLKSEELRGLKAAQYALRNISDSFESHDPMEAYDE